MTSTQKLATMRKLMFVVSILIIETNSMKREDYQYPADYQEDTEGADPPEEYANETIIEGPSSPHDENDARYPPEEKMKGRAFKKGDTYKWKTLNIYIQRTQYTEDEIKIINKAIFVLYKLLKPCGVHVGIWKPRQTAYGDYVKIVNKNGCWSNVGRVGGEQLLSLGASKGGTCVTKATVLHGMLHALGFDHEQNRPDRDEHVEILWDNIKPEFHGAFSKQEDSETFGVPYNEHSLMHYNDYGFAKEEGLKTMKSKHGKVLGFQHDNENPLQPSDVEMIKKAYCTS